MSTIKCTKRVTMGLFSIEEGTVWTVEGIKYGNISKVRIREKNNSSVWVEIPQSILAECFELI